MSSSPSGHAVVLGAGIAGLLAAAVLTDYYEHVTLIERDQLPTGPLRRPGVPQAAHVHGLVLQGRLTIEQLIPGFTDDLIAAGAAGFDFAADLALRTPYGWGRRVHSDLHSVTASRPLIEWAIRRRIAANPAIQIIDQMQAVGLRGTGHTVHAVITRQTVDGSRHEIPAGLFIDATGRGTRAGKWLADLGCPPPGQLNINANVGYASRIYRIPAGHSASWRACYLQLGAAGPTRGGTLIPIEDNCWQISLLGVGPDRPTSNDDHFLKYAQTLPSPIIADALAEAEPLTPVRVTNSTSNRYLDLSGSGNPHNLLILGDAACSFNPLYAQGMTAAALAAQLLAHCLTRYRRQHLAQKYHGRLSSIIRRCWALATAIDFRPSKPTTPRPSLIQQLTSRYLDHVLAACTQDPVVLLGFLRVFNMLTPPASLATPAMATRVLCATRRGHTTAIPEQPPPLA